MPGEAFLNARFRHPLESRKSRGPFGVELGTEEGEQLVVIHGFSQEEGCRAMVDLSLTYYYPDCGASGLQPGRCSRCRLIDLVEELPCRTNSAHRYCCASPSRCWSSRHAGCYPPRPNRRPNRRRSKEPISNKRTGTAPSSCGNSSTAPRSRPNGSARPTTSGTSIAPAPASSGIAST